MAVGGYFIATAAQSAGSFLAVALLARILSPSEFGRWALLEPAVLIGGQIALVGLGSGVIKLVAQDKYNLPDALQIVSKIIRWTLPSIGVLAAISAFLFFTPSYWAIAIGLWVLIEGLLAVHLNAFRGANQPTAYVKSVCARMGVIIFGLSLMLVFGKGIPVKTEYAVIWWALASTMSLTILMLVVRREKKTEVILNANQIGNSAVKYGAPILIGSVLAAIIGNGDRYVLAMHMDARTIGEYAVMAKVASALNLLVTPINLWWPTARFQHLEDSDGGVSFFSRSALQLVLALSVAVGCLWLFSPILVSWLSPHVVVSPLVVAGLALASFFTAISLPFNIGTLKEGHTHWAPIGLVFSVVIQIGCALVFVKYWGVIGVAWATFLGALFSFCFQNWISQRIHPIPFPYFYVVTIIVWLVISAGLAFFVFDNAWIRLFVFLLEFTPLVFLLRSKIFLRG